MRKVWFVVLALAIAAGAQSSHSVSLSWGASPDAGANPSLTYNVYRAASGCTGTPTFSKLNTASVSGTSFSDLSVSVGNTYCYEVTAVLNGLESAPSNSAPAVILPAAPQTLVVVPK